MQRKTTLMLTAIAGFTDTLSFVCAGALFSAHVTGNFVVFGASIAHGLEQRDYIKLISFPVFVLFVMIGTLVFGASASRQWRLAEMKLIFLLQAMLFFGVALASLLLSISAAWLALGLVAAMGLQNALHRYLPGPMTTVMTGTVMNWAADVSEKYFRLPAPPAKAGDKPFTGAMIACFAGGCAFAGVIAPYAGLTAAALPAVLLLAMVFTEAKENAA